VQIALALASLNELQVKSSDVKNTYNTAPVTKKVWIVFSPDFGANAGKRAIVVRSLYGLKSAGAAFRAHLVDMIHVIGCVPCMVDQDLWMKPEVRPLTSENYWSYVLCYVDDFLVKHHAAMSVLNRIGKLFKLKDDPNNGNPDMYLFKLKRQLHTQLLVQDHLEITSRSCDTTWW
jgi:hypothetical protein